MGGERRHRVQGAGEGEGAAGFEGRRIELPGQPLLAEGKEGVAVWIDADVERRLQGDAAHQAVVRKRGAEGAVEGAAGRLLVDELGAADEAGGELDALAPIAIAPITITAEAQGYDHAVAVQPVLVAHAAEGEAGGTVQVVGAAQEGGNRPLDPQPLGRALGGDGGKGPLQTRSVILSRALDGGTLHPRAPASAISASAGAVRRAVRKRAMQGVSKLQA